MATTKTVLLMILGIYFVLVGTFLSSIGAIYESKTKTLYNDNNQSCDCGTLTCAEYKLIYNGLPDGCTESNINTSGLTLVTGINVLQENAPWLNTIFIVIPAIICILIILTYFIPALNIM